MIRDKLMVINFIFLKGVYYMKKKLPKLPRGEGSFFEHRDKIGYRKTFTLPSGEKIKKTVYADTVSDCMTKMKIQERHRIMLLDYDNCF